jgi:alpha/beta superfamily hydrolase
MTSMKQPEEPLETISDGLRLEGRLRAGTGETVAVVLHPHPSYGGDMDNHVVMALCETLAGAGATTLRFNFRGAGRSEGAFEGGAGELNDALAAVALLREERPDAPLVVAGYSFGAAIAARLAADVAPAALILVSPPVGMMQLPALEPSMPALLISGTADHIAPAATLEPLASAKHRVVGVPGVDHGWWPGIDELNNAVAAFIADCQLTV